jgi:hypothetical protein
MRWLIACAAFFIPLLLAVAIGGSFADTSATQARISQQTLGELRDFTQVHAAVLFHFAPAAGSKPTASMPHLALEQFSQRGVDEHGHPWFQLVRPPAHTLAAGLVLPGRADEPLAVPGGRRPDVLIPLNNGWAYWELHPAAPRPQPAP